MSKFKKGDVVELLNDNCLCCEYKVGDVQPITEFDEDDPVAPYRFGEGSGNWVQARHIKLAE